MATHGQLELGMLELCIQNATHSELRDFWKQAGISRREQIGTVSRWLGEWHQARPSPAGRHADEISKAYGRSAAELKRRKAAEFEQAFLNELRQRYREEQQEAEACQRGAIHPELKGFCQKLEFDRRSEERTLDRWICEWHRDCVEQHHDRKEAPAL